MSNSQTALVKKILLNSRSKLEKFKKILGNPKKKYTINYTKKNNKLIVEVSIAKKIILSAECVLLGYYDAKSNLWLWGTQVVADKNLNKTIKKIKSYDYLFEADDNPLSNFFYQVLTQDIIKIYDIKELVLINYLLLYLTDYLYYYDVKTKSGDFECIFFKKIIKYYV